MFHGFFVVVVQAHANQRKKDEETKKKALEKEETNVGDRKRIIKCCEREGHSKYEKVLESSTQEPTVLYA